MLIIVSTSFAQFTNDRHQGAKPKENIDTIITTKYRFNKDDTVTKIFENKTIDALNKKGQVTESDCYFTSQNSNHTSATFSYDDKGNLTDVKYYIRAPMLWYESIYSYSPATRSVSVNNAINKDNKLARYAENPQAKLLVFKLDNSGKIIEERNYRDAVGKVLEITRNFTYNSKGYLIEMNALPYDCNQRPGMPVRFLYSYNNTGNLLKEVSTQYHPINHSIIRASTRIYTYAKFDKHHNWLVQNIYIDGKLTGMVEKRIVYRK
ncbi:hypothetical protein [Mucilaginibacter sp. UR6-11]|uniref:hypothetical protein n=1 Tax=Mucilaginibacter sp. UR6-11 TaxID=1435644 RepID=UPI001E4BA2F1|nr:hypothetical protein [Mucilaginibacter sp. UR6-11]MCC8425118.1 hypothetical protein [Mucilaginibacter sp. UR6-11]